MALVLFSDRQVPSSPRSGLLSFPVSAAAHTLVLGLAFLVSALKVADLPDPPGRVPTTLDLPRAPAPPQAPRPPASRTSASRRAGPAAPSPGRPAAAPPATPSEEPDGIPKDVPGDLDECPGGCSPSGRFPALGPGSGDGPGGGAASDLAPMRVSALRPPRKLKDVPPVYPPLALLTHLQGKVVLECTIGADGRVRDLEVTAGSAILAAAAVDAVRQWIYAPTLLGGVPVPVILTVTVEFKTR